MLKARPNMCCRHFAQGWKSRWPYISAWQGNGDTPDLENPDPNRVLALNPAYWRIKIMHRDKDVIPGEDQYTNRLDHAPRNIFTRRGATRTLLKRITKSPTRAIEAVQDNRNKAIRSVTIKKIGVL